MRSEPSVLRAKTTGAPYGEVEGTIQPMLRRLVICVRASLNSAGDIGRTPRADGTSAGSLRLMWWENRGGGRPGGGGERTSANERSNDERGATSDGSVPELARDEGETGDGECRLVEASDATSGASEQGEEGTCGLTCRTKTSSPLA